MRKSIDQIERVEGSGVALPDFRAPGTLARTVVAVNGAALLAALARSSGTGQFGTGVSEVVAFVEPPLLAVLAVLFALDPRRRGWSWAGLAAFAVALAALLAVATRTFLVPGDAPADSGYADLRALLLGGSAAALALHYLYLRGKAFSPALTEARLIALTARIRPHFLFNSLNAVLGTMRADPRRAEAALEELAELFRVLMAEHRDLVPLETELALCRQYLDLERLRLGERLRLRWETDDCPPDALVPPLMLQPLLENAVYHGIEPAAEGGEVEVRIARQGDRIEATIVNPYSQAHAHPAGNRMALDNIRERLRLFFDVEARIDTAVDGPRYRVSIVFPYRRAP